MRRLWMVVCVALPGVPAWGATVYGQVRGVVHDAQHRPVAGATVTVQAEGSALRWTVVTDAEGGFRAPAVPLGEYRVRVAQAGFRSEERLVTVEAGTERVVHVQMAVAGASATVTVRPGADGPDGGSATPVTLVSRAEIEATPGADRTNSLQMITGYVPGVYMTHDMLHIRGGHQVSWLLDGVAIPNTNIASNVGAQVDPKDIDTLEVERGSYTAAEGDRTYGVFNVAPRSGFDRNREAEVVVSAGSFAQTNDQINVGDHTERFAYYASANGNRSGYGLSTPVEAVLHDRGYGYGGFTSMQYNQTAKDQLRLVAQVRRDVFEIPYDPDPSSAGNAQFDSSGLRDEQREADAVVSGSWLHTFKDAAVLQVAPFYHWNRADYRPDAADTPVATTADRSSQYVGGQVSVSGEVAHNVLEAGVYGFGQRDGYVFGAAFHDGSGAADFAIGDAAAGGVAEEYVSDTYRATGWLTLTAGVRQSTFRGAFAESTTSPRVGAAVRVPRLGWVFRGFYGRFYQPPPLLTAAGPLVQYAQANDTAFKPLHGERDEEHQFGVEIPWRGWRVDADTFRTRVRNFLDHSNVGDSSIYFPVTVDGALVRAWELTVRSPRLWRVAQAHLAYSNQIAEQRGNITGGLVCAPVGSPACDAGWSYTPVDHDQRNTLNAGVSAVLPRGVTAAASLMYGSGFVNGGYDPDGPPADPRYPNPYLPEHTTFDLAVGKSVGERLRVTVNALNVANRRVLLDNSVTFGGFHWNDPREVYAEVRYRFGY